MRNLGQYRQVKAEHPGVVVLVREGDFYEAYEDDAKTVARVCEVTLMERDNRGEYIPTAAVPHHCVERYLAVLLKAGIKTALAESLKPPYRRIYRGDAQRNRDLRKPVLDLKCAVCGGECRGRNWYRGKRGYGICEDCVEIERPKYRDDYEFEGDYGYEGENYNVPHPITYHIEYDKVELIAIHAMTPEEAIKIARKECGQGIRIHRISEGDL